MALADIANSDTDEAVRFTAVRRIEDGRLDAAKHITDQSVLLGIAENDSDESVRDYARQRLYIMRVFR